MEKIGQDNGWMMLMKITLIMSLVESNILCSDLVNGHRGKRRTGMDMGKLHHTKLFGMRNVILEKC